MQAGKKFGSQTLNDALYQLYMAREVTADECLRVTSDPTEFQRMIGQLPAEDDGSGKSGPAKPGTARPAAGTPVRR
jgi:twitching motility protein PilT